MDDLGDSFEAVYATTRETRTQFVHPGQQPTTVPSML